MSAYTQLDYLDLDDQFSEEELMVRDTVRSWISERFNPVVMEHFEEGTFPMELTKELAELGVFGPTTPEEYGGAGMNGVAYGLICQELERGDSGLRSFCSVQGSLVMWPIHEYGSEEQKREYLPKLAAGEMIGCFGLTEPDFGSNPGGMLTTAKKDGGDYILNGRKMWITNGSVAQIAIVWAKVEGRVRGFIVPTDSKGFSAPNHNHKWSLRASYTSELVMEDVRVPASAMLPGADGLGGPLRCLTQARYGIAWGVLGAGYACFDETLNYQKERISFDKPIAAFQIPQMKFANMATDLTTGALLALRVGRLKDEGRMTAAHVSMAKRNNCDVALNTARTCRDMLGANGVTLEYTTGRHMLNLESVITYEGTHDIHTLSIGAEVTGIMAFR